MKKWFNSFNDDNKLNLTIVCRWYAYHFDTYINSIYRKQIYPRMKLINHANLLHDEENHSFWTDSLETTFKNNFCDKEYIEKSPFHMFIGKSPVLLSKFIKQINKLTYVMDKIFIRSGLYYSIKQSIKVYRGLNIPKGNTLLLDIKGLTSLTTNIDTAEQFAFTIYGNEDDGEPILYDERKYDSYIIEFELLENTLVIPMNICTIQDENELILISQGILKQLNVKEEKIRCWNSYINLEGELIDPNEGELTYTKIKAHFINDYKLPEYGEFKISDISVIDDL
jgi:hypothetical protein